MNDNNTIEGINNVKSKSKSKSKSKNNNNIEKSQKKKDSPICKEKKKEYNYLLGLYYGLIHYLYMLMLFFIVMFSTRITDLLCILFILTINLLAVVVARDCPLNILEQKYLPISCLDIRNFILQNVLPLEYKCNHEYEKTLEYLVNAWTATAMKCFFLIIWRMCSSLFIMN